MDKPLLGYKIAVLVASGFSEKDLTVTQKALMALGADIRIIGMTPGLLNSWDGEGWGLSFASDQTLNEALAIDFSMLIVPGGRRSIEKLKLTAHTKRFLNGFLNSRKAVALFGEALALLPFAGQGAGYTVSGPEGLREELEAVGLVCSASLFSVSDCLISGGGDDLSREAYVRAVVDFFLEYAADDDAVQAAA